MLARTLGFTALALLSTSALAAPGIPYPTPGVYNAEVYTFTALSSQDLIAYSTGATAGFENQLGVLVNGVQQGGYGLDNQSTGAGTSYNFGPVSAGDTLTFILHNISLQQNAFSDPSMNIDYDSSGSPIHDHVYSTIYNDGSLGNGIPSGTYVAFEDLPFPDSDFNYNDEAFVFTNTSVTPAGAPAPLAGAGLLSFFGAGGLAMRKRAKRAIGSLLLRRMATA